jgi:hypothetical protein
MTFCGALVFRGPRIMCTTAMIGLIVVLGCNPRDLNFCFEQLGNPEICLDEDTRFWFRCR